MEELCFSLCVVSSRKDHSIIKQFRWNRTSGDLLPKPGSSRRTLTATAHCSEQLKVEKIISSILWTYRMSLHVIAQKGAVSKMPTGTGLVSACISFIYFSEETIQLLDLIHDAA